jgi:hypothetical protein
MQATPASFTARIEKALSSTAMPEAARSMFRK